MIDLEKISATKDLSSNCCYCIHVQNESDDSSQIKAEFTFTNMQTENIILKIVTGTADQDLAGSSVAISDKGETIIIGNPSILTKAQNSGSVTVLRKVADDNSPRICL